MSMSWEQAVSTYRSTASKRDLEANYMDLPQAGACLRFAQSREFRATQRLFARNGGKLLDVGAGSGVFSVAFAQAKWSVTALEPDGSEVTGVGAIQALADQVGVPITAVQGAMESIPLPDASVDVVFGRQVLHHVGDLALGMREVARVLNVGGCAVFTREHVATNAGQLAKFLDAHPLHHLYGGENALRVEEYLHPAEEAGLTLRRVLLPLDSVINRYPLTGREIVTSSARGVRAFLNDRQCLYQRIRGENNDPGRLYSFVWEKR